MDDKDKDAVLLFDTLYTTNHIQMLKILLSYIPDRYHIKLALFIKYQEFQYTLHYMKSHTISTDNQEETDISSIDFVSLYKELSPYFTEEEKAKFSQFIQMKNAMDQYRDILKLMPVIEPLMNSNENDSSESNMEEILKNLLSEEQISMFNIFQNMK